MSDIPTDIKLPHEVTKYDYRDVNNAILHNTAPVADNRTKLYSTGIYRNYIYQLFIMEFLNYASNERNQELRKEIYAVISAADFKSKFSEFVLALKKLTADMDQADVSLLQTQISLFGYADNKKKDVIDLITATKYNFDNTTINYRSLR
jgi:hypothetical protein